MKKSLTAFVTENHIKSLDNEETIEAIAEHVVENDLNEEDTTELVNELFGIGATVSRLRAKAAHPFKLAHAALKGAAERVRDLSLIHI